MTSAQSTYDAATLTKTKAHDALTQAQKERDDAQTAATNAQTNFENLKQIADASAAKAAASQQQYEQNVATAKTAHAKFDKLKEQIQTTIASLESDLQAKKQATEAARANVDTLKDEHAGLSSTLETLNARAKVLREVANKMAELPSTDEVVANYKVLDPFIKWLNDYTDTTVKPKRSRRSLPDDVPATVDYADRLTLARDTAKHVQDLTLEITEKTKAVAAAKAKLASANNRLTEAEQALAIEKAMHEAGVTTKPAAAVSGAATFRVAAKHSKTAAILPQTGDSSSTLPGALAVFGSALVSAAYMSRKKRPKHAAR